jgi:TonB family protein
VHVAKATAVNPNSTLSEGKAVFGTASPESPTPAATATPNCATNDTPVQMIASPPQPEIPPAARADQANGIARVRLVVNPQGGIESATIAGSSGSSSMDQIAVVMARAGQYAPATHACKAIASDYLFSVKFFPW